MEIEETHKDILFIDWDARIKQVELVVAREAGLSKKIIKAINHMLLATNLKKVGNAKEMPDLTTLSKGWQEKAGKQMDELQN